MLTILVSFIACTFNISQISVMQDKFEVKINHSILSSANENVRMKIQKNHFILQNFGIVSNPRLLPFHFKYWHFNLIKIHFFLNLLIYCFKMSLHLGYRLVRTELFNYCKSGNFFGCKFLGLPNFDKFALGFFRLLFHRFFGSTSIVYVCVFIFAPNTFRTKSQKAWQWSMRVTCQSDLVFERVNNLVKQPNHRLSAVSVLYFPISSCLWRYGAANRVEKMLTHHGTVLK